MINTNIKNYETTFNLTSLLVDFLQSKTYKSKKYILSEDTLNNVPLFYVNVLNNREAKWLEGSADARVSFKDMLKREYHNYCHITYIDYMEDANGYKSFGDRKYAYVMCQNSDTVFSLRKDLIDNWGINNASDEIIIVNMNNGNIYNFNMQDVLGWFSDGTNGRKMSRNEQGNIVVSFNLPEPVEYNHYTLDNTKGYLYNSWPYIGQCSYSRYRKGTRLLVALYNEDGTLKGKQMFKSLKQVYDEVGFKNIGSYKTFQRLFKTETVTAMYLTSDSGSVYFVSTDICITVPENVENIEAGVVETEIEYSDNTSRMDISTVLDNRNNNISTDNIDEIVDLTLLEYNVVEKKAETSDFIKWKDWGRGWDSYRDYLRAYKRKFAEEIIEQPYVLRFS